MHVVGNFSLVASVPLVLQEPNSVEALKIGIAAGLSGVTAGMVEVSVLIPSSRRLRASSGTQAQAGHHNRRLQFSSAGEVFIEYRIVLLTSDDQTASFIIRKFEGAPVQMMLSIQHALSDSNVPTIVADMKFSTPFTQTIHGHSCTFRFWRFLPVTVRDKHGASGVALTSLIFYDVDIVNIPVTQAYVDTSSNGVVPMNAFDGNPSTDWHNTALLPLQIDFGVPKDIAFYRWLTSNVAQAADPLRWRLEASNDSLAWNVVDNRAWTDYMTPSGRQSPAGLFRVGCSGGQPRTAMAGATDNDGASPLLIIGFVMGAIMTCGLCVGLLMCIYRRPLEIAYQERKARRVNLEEKVPPHLQGDSRLDLNENPLQSLRSRTIVDTPKALDDTNEALISVSEKQPEPTPLVNDNLVGGLSTLEDRIQSSIEHAPREIDKPPHPQEVSYRSDHLQDNVYPEGTIVGIVNLVDCHEHNGAMAEVVKYDNRKDRYIVKMVTNGKKVALRRDNLILAMCQDMLQDLEEEEVENV